MLMLTTSLSNYISEIIETKNIVKSVHKKGNVKINNNQHTQISEDSINPICFVTSVQKSTRNQKTVYSKKNN